MKSIIASVFVSLVSINLFAATPSHFELQAQESHVLFHVLENDQPTSLTAVAIIDRANQKLQVSLYRDICGHYTPTEPGVAKCMAMPVLKNRFEVPLMSIEEDACGSLVLKGEEDKTPVDGLHIQITLKDNGKRICDDVVAGRIVIDMSIRLPATSESTSYYMY